MKLILVLVPLALVLGGVPLAPAAAPPVCSDVGTYHADCGAGVEGIEIVLGHCQEPDCGYASWEIRVTSCSALPGVLAVEWEFFLSDVPAFGDAAATQTTGDPDCPERAVVHRHHNGGTFQMPVECVFAKAASPAGAASRLRCKSS